MTSSLFPIKTSTQGSEVQPSPQGIWLLGQKKCRIRQGKQGHKRKEKARPHRRALHSLESFTPLQALDQKASGFASRAM